MQEYQLVNVELLRYANENKNTYYVTAEGLTSNPDGIHLNAISQRKFGIRYYEVFSKRKNVLNPLENEVELLDACINKPYTNGEKMYLQIMDFTLGKMTYEEFAAKATAIKM